jgi:hypothetical protein
MLCFGTYRMKTEGMFLNMLWSGSEGVLDTTLCNKVSQLLVAGYN